MARDIDIEWMRRVFEEHHPDWREGGWACLVDQGNGYAHILPVFDIGNVHEPDPECICGPKVELLTDHPPETPDVWMYTHHALDGRE